MAAVARAPSTAPGPVSGPDQAGRGGHPGDERAPARMHRRDGRPDQPGDVGHGESQEDAGGIGHRAGRLLGVATRSGRACGGYGTRGLDGHRPPAAGCRGAGAPGNAKGRGRHPPRRRPRPWNRSSAPQRRAVGSLWHGPVRGAVMASIPEHPVDSPDHELEEARDVHRSAERPPVRRPGAAIVAPWAVTCITYTCASITRPAARPRPDSPTSSSVTCPPGRRPGSPPGPARPSRCERRTADLAHRAVDRVEHAAPELAPPRRGRPPLGQPWP